MASDLIRGRISLHVKKRVKTIDASAGPDSIRTNRTLAAAPDAAHAGHDHRAAWPVFLHVGRVTHPHGVRTGEIPRINAVRFRLVTGIDAKPRRRPPNGGLRGWRVDRGRLRGPRPLRHGLRLGAGREQRTDARKSHRYCQSPDTHPDAHPNRYLPYALRLPRQRQPPAGPVSGQAPPRDQLVNENFPENRVPLLRIML